MNAHARTPGFFAEARVTTSDRQGTLLQSRTEVLRCAPGTCLSIEREVEGTRQGIASDGRFAWSYAIFPARRNEQAIVQGFAETPASIRLESQRTNLDMCMAWPLSGEIAAKEKGQVCTHGLIAWLSQPDVRLDPDWCAVQGTPCLRLVRSDPTQPGRVARYYIDPASNWMPRRFESVAGEQILLEREAIHFEWIASGLCLPVRAIERAPVTGLTVELEIPRDADGRFAAGVLSEGTEVLSLPPGVELQPAPLP